MTFTFTISISPWVPSLLSTPVFVVITGLIMALAMIGLYVVWKLRRGLY